MLRIIRESAALTVVGSMSGEKILPDVPARTDATSKAGREGVVWQNPATEVSKTNEVPAVFSMAFTGLKR